MGTCPDFMGWCPLSFLTPTRSFAAYICIQESLPGPQEGVLISVLCRAQILPLAMSLEYLGEKA